MTKRAKRDDFTHNAWIAKLENTGGYDDLIDVLKRNQPPRSPLDVPDQWFLFQRALYVLMMTARNLHEKDASEWRQVRTLIRDAAVSILELDKASA